MKVLKKNKKVIIGIGIGLFIGLSVTVSAATLITSNNVTYSNSNTSATNVKTALDDLYKKYNEQNFYVKVQLRHIQNIVKATQLPLNFIV